MDNIYAIIPVSKFKNAKTRLSPFLSEEERENLLKAMLHDVTDTLKKHVDKIFIISRDEDVLDYAKKLNLDTILEDENSNLNKALKQAMKYCKGKARKVIIVPSKGGGTNMIIMKPMAIHTRFEGFSYKEHVQAAERKKLNPQVHDSFFMALDVNTAEDLGEIMIHGEKTHTRKYLKGLKVNVEPFRGSERLKVTRG